MICVFVNDTCMCPWLFYMSMACVFVFCVRAAVIFVCDIDVNIRDLSLLLSMVCIPPAL